MSKERDPLQLNPSGPGAINPYAPTTFAAEANAVPDGVEQYRQAHLSHESSVKSIGFLYMLGAVFLVPIGVLTIIAPGIGVNPANIQRAEPVAMGVLYLVLGLFQGFVGYGLRKLRGWARIVGAMYSGIGLLGFPVGTLISGYFLYLLLSEKGRIVFSDSYKAVIEQTPHLKYKASKIVWIVLLLPVLLIVAALAVVFLN